MRMKNSIFCLLTLWALSGFGNCAEFGPSVTLKNGGELRPLVQKSRLERDYHAFLKIPYAKPPIGNLRFEPPQPADPWDGVLENENFGPSCAQFSLAIFGVYGEEDCLHINLFKPVINSTQSLPVMVFFHNGAYMFSSSTNYNADYFMDEPVILVTFNFRLGVLGFLNAGIKEAQGNQGLKDQVMALKWVKENVDKFGGDPDKITLFGDLAGGASIHYHMYSEMSKGLFSAAISQGGSVLCTWAYIANPMKATNQLSQYVGNSERNMTKLVDQLKTLNVTELVSAIPKYFEWGVNPINPFGPSVERVADGHDKFLNDTPYWTIQKEPVNNVPWIVGANSDLGLVAAAFIVNDKKSTEELNKDWHNLAPLIFYYRDITLESDDVSDSIKKEYFKDKKIDLDTLQNLTDLYSHRLFVHGVRKSVVSHVKNAPGNAPLYLYLLSHRSKKSYVRTSGLDENKYETGPTESDELQYLFDSPNFKYQERIGKDHPHYQFSANLIRLWVHFATHRTTNSTWNDQIVDWKPANGEKIGKGEPLEFLELNSNLSTITEPFKKQLDFWDQLKINDYEKEIRESS